MALIVVFSRLDGAAVEAVDRFAINDETAVLVGQRGNFPWYSARPVEKNSNVTVYATGKGRVVEFSAPIIDPEPFARDVWRLVKEPERTMRLWNALTILATAYQTNGSSSVRRNLVNFSGEYMRTQVRMKGTFSQIRYGTPERGCCISLTPTAQNGFTEFVVPRLRIGGVIYLKL